MSPADSAPAVSKPAQSQPPTQVERRVHRNSSLVVDFKPGDQIHQYELIRELGRGGMGVVYLARDVKLGRRVAMKFLLLQNETFRARFIVEARTTAQCTHENIVVIHAVDEYEGIPYMVLEYMEGHSLGEIRKSQIISPMRVVEFLVPVVRALVRAHQFKIIHRDLKPDNIFVTDTGIVKVLDFGIAKLLFDELDASDLSFVSERDVAVNETENGDNSDLDGATPLSLSTSDYATLSGGGNAVGTPSYMSPEQWGAAKVDATTDIWATGVILYILLTRKHPVAMPPRENLLLAELVQLDKPLPSLAVAAPDISEALIRLVDKCLEKRTENRYSSAQELLTDLEALIPSQSGRRLTENECPYPGLVAFREEDTDRYFGRDDEIRRATSRLVEQPLLVVVGPSGVGKSSFVRAGVVPALKQSGVWRSFSVRPGRRPLAALAGILQEITSGHELAIDAITEKIRCQPGCFGLALRRFSEQTSTRVLLFVDQFEELYTLVSNPEEREAFTRAISSVADDASSPTRVILSMRSDFLDRAAEERVFFEELSRGLFFLPAVSRQGLRDVLVEPAALHGYGFQSEAMIDEMIDELAATPAALPLLQFAAGCLWKERDFQRKILTAESLLALGGVAGTLASHADQILSELSPRMRTLVRAIFERLVTPERTRAIVDLEELRTLSQNPTEIEHCLDLLVGSRLLLIQTRGEVEGAFAEIVHESLLESWPTLKKWLEESAEHAVFLDQLRSASAQWEERGHKQGLLWRGEAIAEARRFQSNYPGELPPREHNFLKAVMFAANRSTRLRRIGISAVIVLLVSLVAVGSVVLVTISKAEKEASSSEKEAKRQSSIAASEASRAKEAESRIQEQLDTIKEKERLRNVAEATAVKAGAQVASSQAELALANDQLRKTLTDAQRLKSKAEAAAHLAKQAEQKERQARQQQEIQAGKLAALLAKERKRVKKLKLEREKILTELK